MPGSTSPTASRISKPEQAQKQEATKAATPVEEAAAEQGPTLDTTAEEMQAYYIVQAILAQMVDPERVILRDQKSYCSVLLDDSNRKPICRLWFNTSQKYIGLFDAAKVETRVPIANWRRSTGRRPCSGKRWTVTRMARPRRRIRRRLELFLQSCHPTIDTCRVTPYTLGGDTELPAQGTQGVVRDRLQPESAG